MSRKADPEAAVSQIRMPGADRSNTLSTARPAPGQMLPGEFFLKDGTPALIWPLLSTDAETLRDLFRRLSPESRQRRFLHELNQLDDPMIRQPPTSPSPSSTTGKDAAPAQHSSRR